MTTIIIIGDEKSYFGRHVPHRVWGLSGGRSHIYLSFCRRAPPGKCKQKSLPVKVKGKKIPFVPRERKCLKFILTSLSSARTYDIYDLHEQHRRTFQIYDIIYSWSSLPPRTTDRWFHRETNMTYYLNFIYLFI